ncbi:sensor histidine kinase [uncultured Vagococcus sp.]|uniref:sensor histidine kinase n=1 Tax=uncultured Vagococcus sp. TaxID=189676 RepID=UPI0028D813AB|nr:sensor histidine kinase [uncultured Vagococcus sp.]
MMSRLTRPLLFVYTFMFTNIILVLTLYAYFYAQRKERWLLELIEAKIFHIPFIVYIFVISLMVSFIVILTVYFVRRAQYGKIEEKIRLLATGNYDSNLFLKGIRASEDDPYITDIDKDLTKVHDNMRTMSKELQILTSRPQMVDGESKEQILREERHRLARELHDSVSQQLFAAAMMLSALQEEAVKKESPDVFQKQLDMVGSIINASQSEMRALLLHLRPITLEGKTLQKGVEQLLRELQTKIQIDMTWEIEDVTLPSGVEDHLFRIVQELLSNTLRHAKASSLEVFLKRVDQNMMLRMIDDGVGFDVDEGRVGSYGLNNIKERVTGMGGSCRIISFKGKGTSVEIRVPVLNMIDESNETITVNTALEENEP